MMSEPEWRRFETEVRRFDALLEMMIDTIQYLLRTFKSIEMQLELGKPYSEDGPGEDVTLIQDKLTECQEHLASVLWYINRLWDTPSNLTRLEEREEKDED